MPEMILRITETGREITDTPEAPANRVDLADIRAWRFFRASPAEFLEQYGRDFCIDHIHAAFEVLTEAVKQPHAFRPHRKPQADGAQKDL